MYIYTYIPYLSWHHHVSCIIMYHVSRIYHVYTVFISYIYIYMVLANLRHDHQTWRHPLNIRSCTSENRICGSMSQAQITSAGQTPHWQVSDHKCRQTPHSTDHKCRSDTALTGVRSQVQVRHRTDHKCRSDTASIACSLCHWSC